MSKDKIFKLYGSGKIDSVENRETHYYVSCENPEKIAQHFETTEIVNDTELKIFD